MSDLQLLLMSGQFFLTDCLRSQGWDWGAGFLTSGPYREISLVSYNHASVIRDVVVQIFPTSPSASAAAKEQEQEEVIENPTSAVRKFHTQSVVARNL